MGLRFFRHREKQKKLVTIRYSGSRYHDLFTSKVSELLDLFWQKMKFSSPLITS